MTGLILMAIGGLLLIIGAITFYNGKERKDTRMDEMDKIIDVAIADGVLTDNERTKIRTLADKNNMEYDKVIQRAEDKLRSLNIDSETELVDYPKKNGLDFEKHIVQRFDRKYFKIKSWAGDKYVNGRYAETTLQPDIILEFKLKEETTNFALECKWRKQVYKGGIEFASKEQFDRYNNFEKTNEIPVFIVIGLGGKGDSPENVYIIPLREMKQHFIHISTLKKYEKGKDKNFYFDKVTTALR